MNSRINKIRRLTVPALIFVLGVSCMLAFGIAGIGRTGDIGYDMKFLYVAGKTWLAGGSAYIEFDRTLAAGEFLKGINEFAYLPNIFPLAALLGTLPYEYAQFCITGLNVLSAFALAAFCGVQLALNKLDKLGTSSTGAKLYIFGIVLGAPFIAHVVWLGQTSLISISALCWAWYFSKGPKWALSGLLIAVGLIKPQLGIFLILWLILEQRWRVLISGIACTLFASLIPILNSGIFNIVLEWTHEAISYRSAYPNALGFRHVFGVQNFLFVLGLPVPNLAPLGVVFILLLWTKRHTLSNDAIFGIILSLTLLFTISHDYDLVALAPLVPVLWKYSCSNLMRKCVSAVTLLLLYAPQRILRTFDSTPLLHYRVLVVLFIVCWVIYLERNEVSKSNCYEITT